MAGEGVTHGGHRSENRGGKIPGGHPPAQVGRHIGPKGVTAFFMDPFVSDDRELPVFRHKVDQHPVKKKAAPRPSTTVKNETRGFISP